MKANQCDICRHTYTPLINGLCVDCLSGDHEGPRTHLCPRCQRFPTEGKYVNRLCWACCPIEEFCRTTA